MNLFIRGGVRYLTYAGVQTSPAREPQPWYQLSAKAVAGGIACL
jgi:hypothetical protein